jgi:hypothetical protein
MFSPIRRCPNGLDPLETAKSCSFIAGHFTAGDSQTLFCRDGQSGFGSDRRFVAL